MNPLSNESEVIGAEADGVVATEVLQARQRELQQQLDSLPVSADVLERARLRLALAQTYNELAQGVAAWEAAWPAFTAFAQAEQWEGAVDACDALYLAEQPDSLRALAHGLWLGVTYPVDPELTINLLDHLVEDTPPQADGAAIAAAAAYYIADLRATGKQRDTLLFFANQLMGKVARRHSEIEDQLAFDFWVKKLELNDPAKFLPRLSLIVNTLTDGTWWIDRDALRARLPVH
jgi:hypothetical protein